MNTNLWHNIFNVVSLVVGGVSWLMLQLGCTEDVVTHVMDCSAAPLDPSWLRILIAVSAVLPAIKLVMNTLRDGLTGLTKPQPPVQK